MNSFGVFIERVVFGLRIRPVEEGSPGIRQG